MEKFTGKPLTFTGPSGLVYTIREQNGGDDEILSEIKTDDESRSNPENITNINNFIQTIVIEKPGGGLLSMNEVKAMNLRDKYYILLKSRMHSLGNKVQFEISCKCGHKSTYEEDLTEFDRDLSIEYPKDFKFNEKAIEPYPNGGYKWIEHELSSGKKIKMKLMDGFSELFILQAGKTALNKNQELYARDLHLFDNGDYVKLAQLNVFSPSEMVELRGLITKYDLQFSLVSECTCRNCKTVRQIPLNMVTDFFFPSEI